jgi:cob(I)alamin adenosyltransferase
LFFFFKFLFANSVQSGGQSSALLHHARSICRRAERNIIALIGVEQIEDSIVPFVNRLSDYLFTAARFRCNEEGKEEIIYKKPTNE